MGKWILAISALLLVNSCTTASQTLGNDKQSPLFGLIYDYIGQPIQGVKISSQEKTLATSDVDGRFVIPAFNFGEYQLTAEKEDFEKIDMSFVFSKSDQILYIRMESYENLWEQAEEALYNREFSEAKSYLDRCAPIGQDAVSDYLWAIYYRLTGENEKSLEVIETLKSNGWETQEILGLEARIIADMPAETPSEEPLP